MFNEHFDNRLAAYLHGELDRAAEERVRQHLSSCERCRRALDELTQSALAVKSLPIRSAPESVWFKIDQQIIALPEERPAGLIKRSRTLQFAAAVGLVGLLVFAVVKRGANPPAKPGVSWQVAAIKGAPQVDKRAIHGSGRLGAGEWLETDAESSARVQIADIGSAEVRPNSRLTLVSSASSEHRMRLQRGELHAKVAAPPRLFLVETPSATAVDLGCEYTLTARPDGSSLLKVMSGWVAMEIAGRASQVSMDMICITRPGTPPGTPYHARAHPDLVSALEAFDFRKGGSAAIDTVLARARKPDALTLWHLVQRVDARDRLRVFAALNRLVPAPNGVTLEKVSAGSREALDAWRDAVEYTVYPPTGFSVTDFAIEVMKAQKKGASK